jgi:hypothetical protein
MKMPTNAPTACTSWPALLVTDKANPATGSEKGTTDVTAGATTFSAMPKTEDILVKTNTKTVSEPRKITLYMSSFATLTRIGDEPNGVEPPSHDELAHRRDPHFVKIVPNLVKLVLNLRCWKSGLVTIISGLAHRASRRFKCSVHTRLWIVHVVCFCSISDFSRSQMKRDQENAIFLLYTAKSFASKTAYSKTRHQTTLPNFERRRHHSPDLRNDVRHKGWGMRPGKRDLLTVYRKKRRQQNCLHHNSLISIQKSDFAPMENHK